jgi:hypothetical protein
LTAQLCRNPRKYWNIPIPNPGGGEPQVVGDAQPIPSPPAAGSSPPQPDNVVPIVNPLRHSSLNNSGSTPTPRASKPPENQAWCDFVDPGTGEIRTNGNGVGPLKTGADWSPKPGF